MLFAITVRKIYINQERNQHEGNPGKLKRVSKYWILNININIELYISKKHFWKSNRNQRNPNQYQKTALITKDYLIIFVWNWITPLKIVHVPKSSEGKRVYIHIVQ